MQSPVQVRNIQRTYERQRVDDLVPEGLRLGLAVAERLFVPRQQYQAMKAVAVDDEGLAVHQDAGQPVEDHRRFPAKLGRRPHDLGGNLGGVVAQLLSHDLLERPPIRQRGLDRQGHDAVGVAWIEEGHEYYRPE